jgi:hypothetical protein
MRRFGLVGLLICVILISSGIGYYYVLAPRGPQPSAVTTSSAVRSVAPPYFQIAPQSGVPGTVFHVTATGFAVGEKVSLELVTAEGGRYETVLGLADDQGRGDFQFMRIWEQMPIPLGDLTLKLHGPASGASNEVKVEVNPVLDEVSKGGFKFAGFSTEHVKVMFEKAVSLEYAIKISNYFEFARWFIGKDFGVYPPRVFEIYIFAKQQDLIDGLVKLAGYSRQEAEYYFGKEGLTPMPINWVQYMTPTVDMQLLGHEYTHAMVDELAGVNSRFAFKWLDEGLAEHEGNTFRAHWYSDAAEAFWYMDRGIVLDAYRRGVLLKLKDMITLDQWYKHIEKSDFEQNLEYAEAYAAVTRLLQSRGFSTVLKFLREWRSSSSFSVQFERVFQIPMGDFESDFVAYVDKESRIPVPEFSVIIHLSATAVTESTYMTFSPWFANPNIYYITSQGVSPGDYAFKVLPDGTVQGLDPKVPLRKAQIRQSPSSFLYVAICSVAQLASDCEALAVSAAGGVVIAAFRYYWYEASSCAVVIDGSPSEAFPDGNAITVTEIVPSNWSETNGGVLRVQELPEESLREETARRHEIESSS